MAVRIGGVRTWVQEEETRFLWCFKKREWWVVSEVGTRLGPYKSEDKAIDVLGHLLDIYLLSGAK